MPAPGDACRSRERDATRPFHFTGSRPLTRRNEPEPLTPPYMNRKNLQLLFGVSLALTLVLSLAAQTPGTGTITGHVFNSVNKEYVRDAEVHVEGTNITVPTENGGYFSLARVPAGKVTVTVTYTGLAPTTAEIDLTPRDTPAHHLQIPA